MPVRTSGMVSRPPEVRPPHPDPKLPNVLLLGDSLSRNYFPEVTKDLAGTANVYLMASSTSVGDPRLPREIREFAAMLRNAQARRAADFVNPAWPALII